MIMPNHSLEVGRSWRKMAAKIAISSRLSLSTGTTFEASPTFNAQKKQTHEMPVPRHTECEGIATFADATHEPGEGDHDYESGETTTRGPNRRPPSRLS